MTAPALTGISTAELVRLLSALERGSIAAPLDESSLRAHGFEADVLLPVLGETSAIAGARLLRTVLAERERPRPTLDLVWTGPEARGATTRDTAVLVRELLASATEQVLIAGFAFDHGEHILAPLHVAMRDRGVSAEIFLDVPMAPEGIRPTAHATAWASRFLSANWPFGAPWPSLYYDPRTATQGIYASLHAKCVVVDLQRTLVTSANFTDRGQSRNIELGVLIDDRQFAEQVAAQWRSLAAARLVLELTLTL